MQAEHKKGPKNKHFPVCLISIEPQSQTEIEAMFLAWTRPAV